MGSSSSRFSYSSDKKDYLVRFSDALASGAIDVNKKVEGHSLLYREMSAVLYATEEAKVPMLAKANLLLKHGAKLDSDELDELLELNSEAFAGSLKEVLSLPILNFSGERDKNRLLKFLFENDKSFEERLCSEKGYQVLFDLPVEMLTSALEVLLAFGFDVTKFPSDRHGSLLHRMIRDALPDNLIVEAIQCCGDVDRTNAKGETLLHFALKKVGVDYKIIEALTNRGASFTNDEEVLNAMWPYINLEFLKYRNDPVGLKSRKNIRRVVASGFDPHKSWKIGVFGEVSMFSLIASKVDRDDPLMLFLDSQPCKQFV